MSQDSGFWPTNGTGDGPNGGYSTDQWQELFAALFTTDQAATQAVLKGYAGELAVSGSASPLSVADGRAIVHGLWYLNTAPVSVAIPTPSIGTTGHRVVLQADYSPQTVRIVLLSSADGVATLPALTQDSLRWEVDLATLTITTGGVISLSDARRFCQFAAEVLDNSVTAAKIVDGAVGAAELAASVAGDGLAGGAGSALSVTADNATIEIASDALRVKAGGIDDTKIGSRVPTLTKRIGGSSSDWLTAGTTEQTPAAVKMLMGSYEATFAAASSGSVVMSLPTGFFSQRPLFFVTGNLNLGVHVEAIANATNQATIAWRKLDGSTITALGFQWLAIGA